MMLTKDISDGVAKKLKEMKSSISEEESSVIVGIVISLICDDIVAMKDELDELKEKLMERKER